MPFYLTPKQDDFNKIPELQACIAEALYDVDSMWRTQGLTPKKSLRAYTLRLCRIWNRRVTLTGLLEKVKKEFRRRSRAKSLLDLFWGK